MQRRVVITGLGIISCVGLDKETFWKNVSEGKSGISKIESFDTEGFSVQIAGEIKNFNSEDYGINKKEARRMDRYVQFALASASEAVKDSKIDFENEDKDRIGVIIGSGVGGMHTLEAQLKVLAELGPSKISPFYIPMMISNMASGNVAIRYGLKGPNYAVASACATSLHAISDCYRIIKNNEADIMIAGGSEAAITPSSVAGFANMKATTASHNDSPETASRPFDSKRDGFVMAEGAGVLVLEELEHALKRNATIYAELVGFGLTCDAHHITNPSPDGAASAMRIALKSAGISIEDVDYINVHGTSTPLGDKSEVTAIKSVFGDRAYQIPISASKSVLGHSLGASGVIESVACIMAIQNGVIPPTANYEYPDPDCDLNCVPNVAIKKDLKYVLKNSFGFGGQNAVLVFKKYE